ncbi:MAG: hypothetical protein ACRC4W_08790 [Treponemataceae bacterium]
MPVKLIFFISVMVLITLFIGFNLDNKTDISAIFYEFKNIPVIVLMLGSFCAGILFSLPFLISSKKKPKDKKTPTKEKKDSKPIEQMPL